MKKKYIKIFIFALFSFFMSSVSVFAREMTIDELGEEASKIQSNAGYVFYLLQNMLLHQIITFPKKI